MEYQKFMENNDYTDLMVWHMVCPKVKASIPKYK